MAKIKQDKQDIESTKTEIQEESQSSQPTPQTQTLQCKVLWVKPTSYAIDFKSHGITIQKELDMEIVDQYITIEYVSDIGNPDFTYKVVSQ